MEVNMSGQSGPKLSVIHSAPRARLALSSVVINVTRCTGGIRTRSVKVGEERINEGEGLSTDRRVEREVDHVEAVKRINAASESIAYMIRKHCTSTAFGWVLHDTGRAAFENDLQEALGKAHGANQYAELVGSARRIAPGLVYATVDMGDPGVAKHVYTAIRETLEWARDSLLTGDPDKLTAVRPAVEGLATLTVGPANYAIHEAAKCVHRAVEVLRGKKGADPQPDLEPLNVAIGWFI